MYQYNFNFLTVTFDGIAKTVSGAIGRIVASIRQAYKGKGFGPANTSLRRHQKTYPKIKAKFTKPDDKKDKFIADVISVDDPDNYLNGRTIERVTLPYFWVVDRLQKINKTITVVGTLDIHRDRLFPEGLRMEEVGG